jgi:predicted PurR-regulated permease PerM
MQVSAFIVIVSCIVFVFVVFFGLVVVEGIQLTYSIKIFRTKLLKRARHILLKNRENSEKVAYELRKLATEIESELVSHPVRLLGLKLNFTMMESLIGGLGVVAVGIYQVFSQ